MHKCKSGHCGSDQGSLLLNPVSKMGLQKHAAEITQTAVPPTSLSPPHTSQPVGTQGIPGLGVVFPSGNFQQISVPSTGPVTP